MIIEIGTIFLFQVMAVFARMVGVFLFLPGFAESYIPVPIRLTFAFIFAVVITPIVGKFIPAMPTDALGLGFFLLSEVLIGTFFALIINLVKYSLEFAGSLIAQQSSLAPSFMTQFGGEQTALVSSFYMMLGIVLIFASNAHHIMLSAIINTYEIFDVGKLEKLNVLTETISSHISNVLMVGFKISAPIMVINLAINIMSGIMGRLMPTMQVAFVFVPLQIALSLLVIALSLVTSMTLFLDFLKETLMKFI
jgi:flagellar biosynthetic protein FliR